MSETTKSRPSCSAREPQTMQEWAHDAARLGYHVFPCAPGGKAPLNDGGPAGATVDHAVIRKWWRHHPQANIGASLGASGVTALCVDPRGARRGDLALLDLELEHGVLPMTRVVAAPNGVLQIHMRGVTPGGVDRPLRGIDARSAGGYVLLPGSRTKEGEYLWKRLLTEDEDPEWRLALARADAEGRMPVGRGPNQGLRPVPPWLAVAADGPPESEEVGAFDSVEDVREAIRMLGLMVECLAGKTGHEAHRAAMCLRRNRIRPGTALGLLLEHYGPRCDPPMSINRWGDPHPLLRKAVRWAYGRKGFVIEDPGADPEVSSTR